MSRIEDLIAELCAEGVEFKPLGACGVYSKSRIDATEIDETNFVGVDNLLQNAAGKVNASYLPNTNRLTAYKVGDILIGNIRPYLKKIWLANGSGGCSGDVLAVRVSEPYRSKLIPDFLYRVLASNDFFSYNMRHAKGAKMPRGSKEAILNYRIPIPPLDVQTEIVNILAKMTELEAELEVELEAELESRRQQHKYYRDALFTFSSRDIRLVAMREVGEFFRGKRFTKTDYVNAGIECIHYGDIYTQYGTVTETTVSHVRVDMRSALRYAGPGDLIIAGVGETVEDVGKAVAWLGHGEVAIHDDCFAFRHSLNPRFVSYYFQTSAFHAEKNKFVARAKVKRLSAESLSKLTIPVPSLEEQDRIVTILDKFDALISEISRGLPAEIAARRRQYAYYRDRLLTFKEVV